jgi:glycosyltransferase involved in cell wall biosynthesis
MAGRRRILIVVTLAEVGGAQTFLGHLVPVLAQRYEVVVAAHGPGPVRRASEEAGATFRPLRHVRRPVNPVRDALGLLELVVLCRRERPHVLHANSSKAAVLGVVAAWLTRVPVRLYTVGGWPFLRSGGLRGRVYLWADRLVGRLATCVVCVAESERREALDARVCSAERALVVRNAVDVRRTPRAHAAHEPPTILSVGRIAEPKDFVTFVQALAALAPRPIHAWITGDGPQRERLEAEVAKLGLADVVELLGERHDVPELMAQSDIFVLSSRAEGLPLALIEAMAAGLPVAASAVGGVPELLGPAGLTVPPGDVKALAACLARLLDDPDLRREYGDKARRRAEEEFDLPRFHRAYLDLYATQLSRAGIAAP